MNDKEKHTESEPVLMYKPLEPVQMNTINGDKVYETEIVELVKRQPAPEDPAWLQRLSTSPLLQLAVASLRLVPDGGAAGAAIDTDHFPRLEAQTVQELKEREDGFTWITRKFATKGLTRDTLRQWADPSRVPAVDLLVLFTKLSCPAKTLIRVPSTLSFTNRAWFFDAYVYPEADRSRMARDTSYGSSRDKAVSDWFSYQLSKGATWADGRHFHTIEELEAYATAWSVPLAHDHLHASLLRLIDRTSSASAKWNPGEAPPPASVVNWCVQTTLAEIRQGNSAGSETKDEETFPFHFSESADWDTIDPAYYRLFVAGLAYFVAELPYQLPNGALYPPSVLAAKLIDFRESIQEQINAKPRVGEEVSKWRKMIDDASEIIEKSYSLYARVPDLLNKRSANPPIPLEARAQAEIYRIKARKIARDAGILPIKPPGHTAPERFNGNGTQSVIFPPNE